MLLVLSTGVRHILVEYLVTVAVLVYDVSPLMMVSAVVFHVFWKHDIQMCICCSSFHLATLVFIVLVLSMVLCGSAEHTILQQGRGVGSFDPWSIWNSFRGGDTFRRECRTAFQHLPKPILRALLGIFFPSQQTEAHGGDYDRFAQKFFRPFGFALPWRRCGLRVR